MSAERWDSHADVHHCSLGPLQIETLLDGVSLKVLTRAAVPLFAESRKSSRARTKKEQREASCPTLRASVSARWDGNEEPTLLVPSEWERVIKDIFKGCGTFSRGEETQTFFPFRCPQSPPKQPLRRGGHADDVDCDCVQDTGDGTEDAMPRTQEVAQIGIAVREEGRAHSLLDRSQKTTVRVRRSRWAPTQEPSMPEKDVPGFDWHVGRRGPKAWPERRGRKTWVGKRGLEDVLRKIAREPRSRGQDWGRHTWGWSENDKTSCKSSVLGGFSSWKTLAW